MKTVRRSCHCPRQVLRPTTDNGRLLNSLVNLTAAYAHIPYRWTSRSGCRTPSTGSRRKIRKASPTGLNRSWAHRSLCVPVTDTRGGGLQATHPQMDWVDEILRAPIVFNWLLRASVATVHLGMVEVASRAVNACQSKYMRSVHDTRQNQTATSTSRRRGKRSMNQRNPSQSARREIALPTVLALQVSCKVSS